MTKQAQLMEMVLKERYNLPVIEEMYDDPIERYHYLAPDERDMIAAMYALKQSTEAARDERYPASNWKVTQ